MEGRIAYLPAQIEKKRFIARRDYNKFFLAGSDVLALLLACCLGGVVRDWLRGYEIAIASARYLSELADTHLAIYGLLLFGALVWFWAAGHYTKRIPFWDELREILLIVIAVALTSAAVAFLIKLDFPRLWWGLTWLFTELLVPLLRVQTKRWLMRAGRWQRPTVIIGSSENAREAAEALWSEPLLGFDLVGFVEPESKQKRDARSVPERLTVRGREFPVMLMSGEPEALLDSLGHPHVVLALEEGGLQEHRHLLQRLTLRYPDLNVVPALRGLPLFGMELSHFFSHEVLLLRVRNNLNRRAARVVKRAFDIVGASILLILLAPLFAAFTLMIRRAGGDAFFGHKRVGRYGKLFKCYKFRSMVPNAEQVLQELLAKDPAARAEWERDFKLKNDPRITRIGAFLRKTSLDELPQLWNVLKGEMTLVGPRPIIPAELERYGQQADYYLWCKPGMTGLWQISGRNDIDYGTRVYLDSWYVKNWSLWYDMVILVKTIKVVLAKEGAY